MLNVVVAVVAMLLLVVTMGTVIRFAVLSPLRRRDARQRLEEPDADGVEQACGFPPPADLVRLYREGSLTRLVEFSLVDKTQHPNKRWSFGEFYPLTYKDVLARRKIHGITAGIPIAGDMDKGVYYAISSGRIVFRPAGRKPVEAEVAPSAEALARFDVVDEEETEHSG